MKVELTVGDFLRRASEVYPDRIAVVDEPGTEGTFGAMSFGEMARRATSMASHLDDMGIAHGGRVAIVSPNSARFLISYFGVSAFGRVLVPINFRLNAEEISYIVEHSGSELVLFDPDLDEVIGSLDGVRSMRLDGVADAELFADDPARHDPQSWTPDESATCTINYTSGTTARPKGVQLTHRNCWINASVFGWHIGVNDRDVYLHTLPMFHANGWGMPFATTAMGVRHVILRKVDGEEILRRIETEGVTLLCCAPAVIATTLEAASARLQRGEFVPGRGTVRIVVAGAPPPRRTIERIETELGWEFIQIYGLTETSPLLTINRSRSEWDDLEVSDRAALLSRAGAPAVGVEIAVDIDGEVLARSNHVFESYWNQPDETTKALEGGWFHTGDGGLLDGAYTVITDRKKDVIITGGENVSSIEVEDCLFLHPAVAEVAVIGVPDEKWGETVKALVVLRPGHAASESDLIDHCRSHMAHFKAPRTVEFRPELARTATGKLQKFKLREPYWSAVGKGVN